MTKQSKAALLTVVNEFMRNSPPEMKDARQLLATVTESLLMKENQYKGFNYTYWLDKGCEEWRSCGEVDFPQKYYFLYGPSGDDTRIVIY
jgi:hypothetical protein